MTFGRGFIGAVCTTLVLGGAVALAPTASAAACDPENLNARSDFDGDGSADVAVGMPWYSDAAGAVDLRGTSSPPLVLRSGAIGAGTGEGDRFGADVALGDLDQDGCADLVISAPAEGPIPGSAGTGGQVHIVFGGVGGLDLSTSVTLAHPSAGVDSFGEKLALVRRGDGHDLYVSAPGSTVNGHARAGEVFRYTITPDATARVKATLREARSQDSAGVPGSAETGDQFGETLAATNRGGVLVGAPEEDIGSIRDAGGIWFLPVNAAGTPIASTSWSQDSPGVAGAAETNDRFGDAIASAGNVAVVGVPNEDSGSKADSGMIQTFVVKNGTFTPGQGITQDSSGIPGALEAGDRFGAAVVVGTAMLCQETINAAVGAPGENIGTKADAGLVTLINVDTFGGCPAKALRQGSGLAGAAEAGDEVGGVLALTRRSTDLEEDYSDRLLIGVPLEDIGAKADAGMVQPASGGITANGQLQESLKFSQGYLQADHYGLVLPTSVD